MKRKGIKNTLVYVQIEQAIFKGSIICKSAGNAEEAKAEVCQVIVI